MAKTHVNTSVTGMGTFPIMTITTADQYTIEGKLNLPKISQGAAASQVVVVVKKNASTIYTGTAGYDGFRVNTSFAINDTISIVLSSSLADDSALNAVKANIDVYQGLE